MIVDQHAM